jgi:hypothetical protein
MFREPSPAETRTSGSRVSSYQLQSGQRTGPFGMIDLDLLTEERWASVVITGTTNLGWGGRGRFGS